MKRVFLALLIASLAACSQGGSGPAEPAPPQEPPFVIASGTFDLKATLVVNECDQSTVWDGPYEAVIDSTSFSMGPWTGTWDALRVQARAESDKDQTTTRSCTVSRWTTVYVTFMSENKFKGTLLYRLRLAGDCGTRTTCTSSWTIVGTRQ